MSAVRSGRALGLLLGAGLDALLGDPRGGHPVAAFGRTVAAVEPHVWAHSRRRGVVVVLGWVGAAAAVAVAAERVGPAAGPRVALTAAATWAVLGGATLLHEATAMQHLLAAGDLPGARPRLAHLCSRDARTLDEGELARATVESVAENTSDAVVAPLAWGAVAGVPGLVGYRVVNTLDAMMGHRSPRYERYGWAAARLDDLVNLLPARLTGVLTAALAPLVGGSPVATVRVLRRDGARHPSPNAGRCEAAFAGALDLRLGGDNRYGERLETRGPLGDGPSPQPDDIARTVRLSRHVGQAALVLAVATAWLLDRPAGSTA